MNKLIRWAVVLLSGLALTSKVYPEPPFRLSYAELVPTVLARSLELQAEDQQVAIAQSEVDLAQGERRPKLGFSTGYTFAQDNVVRGELVTFTTALAETRPLTNSVLDTKLSLRMPVYTGGRLESAIHEKRFLLESDRQNLQRVRQQAGFLAKRAYLSYLLARENEEVARLALEEAKQTLKQAQARVEAGSGTKFELLQAQLALSTRKQQVVENHSEVEKSQAELANVFHLPVQTEFEISESLQPMLVNRELVPSRELKALTIIALDRRPELAALRARISAVQEAENGASSGMKPQFSVAVNYNVLGAGSMLYGGVSLMGELSIPLYDGGITAARVDGLKHRKLQLAVHQQKQLDEIALQVKTALLAVEDVEARLSTATAAVDQGQEASRLAEVRYKLGVGTSLELVTAQADYANARFVLANARYRQMVALAQLNLALGVDPQ